MPTKTSQSDKTKTAKPSKAKNADAGDTVINDSADSGASTNGASTNGVATNGVSSNGTSASGAKKSAKGKSPLTPKQIEHFQSLLLTERARLEEEREQIRARSGAVDGALPEEGDGGDEDTADLASAMMDKEMDLSVEDEIEDLLAAVDHALQKVEDGTYGVCDMSGELIPLGRLELIPYAALTVECQALAEGG